MSKELLELLEKVHDGKIRFWDDVLDYCCNNNIQIVEYKNGVGIGDDFVSWAYLDGEEDLMNDNKDVR